MNNEVKINITAGPGVTKQQMVDRIAEVFRVERAKIFSAEDVERIVDEALEEAMPVAFAAWEARHVCTLCALPWYRRFWRWVTRAKT